MNRMRNPTQYRYLTVGEIYHSLTVNSTFITGRNYISLTCVKVVGRTRKVIAIVYDVRRLTVSLVRLIEMDTCG